jgi:hypothetical protein
MSTEENQLTKTALDDLAERIKAGHISTCSQIAEAAKQAWQGLQTAAEVGKLLLEAKAICRHGQFQDFCEIRLNLHRRTAQRYIAAYKNKHQLQGPQTQALQSCFDLLDFKPAATAPVSGSARPTGLFRFTTSFWEWTEKAPPAEWSDDEKSEFLGDLDRREKLAAEQGWR